MRVFHQASRAPGARKVVLKDSKFRSDDADVPIRAAGSQRLFQRSWISTLGIKDLSALGRHEVWNDAFADVEDRITSVMSDSIIASPRGVGRCRSFSSATATQKKHFLLPIFPRFAHRHHRSADVCGHNGFIGRRRLATLCALASSQLAGGIREDISVGTERAIQINGHYGPFAVTNLRPDRMAKRFRPSWCVQPVHFHGSKSSMIYLENRSLEALIVPNTKKGKKEPSGVMLLCLDHYRPERSRDR
jgi:hypothetical protein